MKEIYKLLDDNLEETEIILLSDGYKNAIEEAKEQIENGEFLTNEQANKEMSKWLNK